MQRRVYCLGACASFVGLGAVALLVAAPVLGTDYSGVNVAVKRQIDKVGTLYYQLVRSHIRCSFAHVVCDARSWPRLVRAAAEAHSTSVEGLLLLQPDQPRGVCRGRQAQRHSSGPLQLQVSACDGHQGPPIICVCVCVCACVCVCVCVSNVYVGSTGPSSSCQRLQMVRSSLTTRANSFFWDNSTSGPDLEEEDVICTINIPLLVSQTLEHMDCG